MSHDFKILQYFLTCLRYRKYFLKADIYHKQRESFGIEHDSYQAPLQTITTLVRSVFIMAFTKLSEAKEMP